MSSERTAGHSPVLSGLQALPWAKQLLDYTDQVVGALTPDLLGWRPGDGSQGWFFSAGELAMHIVDSRHDALLAIDGKDAEASWFIKEYGGAQKPWEFEAGTLEQIMERLRKGRAKFDGLLARPCESLMGTSPALIATYEEILAKLKAKGEDATEREWRGPGRIMNTLMFYIAHEQSHRSVLQHYLRLAGADVPRLA
jgi:uncharacterized damage-inducible protein DinB